jgi:colicin import membrane protein
MKSILFAIFSIAIQAISTMAIAENIDSKLTLELSELKQSRQSTESKFKVLEAACYKKFAVSSCLQDIKSEKLLALADIKRRELEINDQKRQLKADAVKNEQLKKTDKEGDSVEAARKEKTEKTQKPEQTTKSGKSGKLSPEEKNRLNASSNDPSPNNPSPNNTRNPKDISKLSEQRTVAAQKRVFDSNKKLAESKKKTQLRNKKLSQSEIEATKYNKKMLEAKAHKDAVEKAAAEKTKPKSASLPIPTLNPLVTQSKP